MRTQEAEVTSRIGESLKLAATIGDTSIRWYHNTQSRAMRSRTAFMPGVGDSLKRMHVYTVSLCAIVGLS